MSAIAIHRQLWTAYKQRAQNWCSLEDGFLSLRRHLEFSSVIGDGPFFSEGPKVFFPRKCAFRDLDRACLELCTIACFEKPASLDFEQMLTAIKQQRSAFYPIGNFSPCRELTARKSDGNFIRH